MTLNVLFTEVRDLLEPSRDSRLEKSPCARSFFVLVPCRSLCDCLCVPGLALLLDEFYSVSAINHIIAIRLG